MRVVGRGMYLFNLLLPRAGRCQFGICYRLFSRARYASMIEYQLPEILRLQIHVCMMLRMVLCMMLRMMLLMMLQIIDC